MFNKREKKGGDLFVSLKAGDSVVGVCRGDIKVLYKLWDGNKSKEVPEGTPKAKYRFKVNFVTQGADGELKAKILEQGGMVHDAIENLESGGYPMDSTWVKIKRAGSGLDTSYSVIPLAESRLSEAELAVVEALPLNPLEPQEEDNSNLLMPEDVGL